MSKRQSPEAEIQKAIVQRLRWHGCFVSSIPNEGARAPQTWARLRARGARSGMPDLLVLQNGNVAFLEVKTPHSRLSPAQAECHDELERQRMRVAVVRSQDEAVTALRGWGFAV